MDGAPHGAGLGATDRLGRLFLGRDDIVAMDDLGHAGERGMLVELGANRGFIAEQQEMEVAAALRSEEHTSELQSLMRISYAVFCLKKKKKDTTSHTAKSGRTTT